MKSAVRLTAMYLYSLASSLEPRKVRAPQATIPNVGSDRMQLTPSGLRTPFCSSVSLYSMSIAPAIEASVPAGVFQTPRVVSVRA